MSKTSRHIFFSLILMAVLADKIQAQVLAPASIDDRAICATTQANDPKVIEEAWLNTRLQHPGLIEAMEQARLSKVAVDPKVGDQNLFWVYNIQLRSYDTVRAELKSIGTISYIWVALAEWSNGHVTSAEVNAIANTLERSTSGTSIDSTSGVLTIDRQIYGNPPNINSSFQKGKGDGKTHFLICDIQDGFAGTSSYIAGFFYSVDVDPNSGAAQNSNRRDMLYIDSYPGIYYNGVHRTTSALATLAHEFQHLIHWNYDPYELAFINEGLSEYAEYLCGFSLRSPSGYLSNTNVALMGWDGTLEDYSRAALWTRYAAEQYGVKFLKNLTQSQYIGIQGFESALTQSGFTTTFAATMQNFFTANWVGSGGTDPVYRYKTPMNLRPSLKADYQDPNNKWSDTLKQQSVQYVSFQGARSFKIMFALPAGVVVKAIESGPSTVRVRDVTSGVAFTSPDFGSLYTSIVFAVGNSQSVLPMIYSYSASGELLHFIVEERHDSGTPHTPVAGTAPYMGFGNNSTTLGMAVRFQPVVPGNVLRKARMMVAFNQEFSGGTAPPTDRRNFIFHVWGDRSGRPGSDIIAPFLVSVDRVASPFGSFVDIDLSAYEKSLTNLAGPIYIGFMEDLGDTVGTYMALDNFVPDDYSYVFRGPGYTRVPNTWETMKEVSAFNNHVLDGYNLMMRAVFEYSDSSAAPPLAIGYLQNPLLSEYIDVVAASTSDLRGSSVSGTFTQSTGSVELRFDAIQGTTKAFIDTTQVLKGSGSVSIRVRAAKKYGVYFTDTTVTVNARLLKPDAAATVASPGGFASVSFQPSTLSAPTYITIVDGENNPQVAPHSGTPLRTVSIGPPGTTLRRTCAVSVMAPGSETELTLALLRDGKWIAVPTTRIQATGELRGTFDRLGVIGVLKASDVEGSIGSIPTEFSLSQNFPNPFNPSTSLEFRVSSLEFVRLMIFDVLGREVATLVNEMRSPGVYTVRWDAAAFPSGVYFARLRAGNFVDTQKMVLAK